jgi:C4-dicarboxylate transporter DctM subunit
VDPVHLGVIFLANLGIGYNTPPIGLNLFIASTRFERPIVELYRATVPFLIILLVTLALITYWPSLSLSLVTLIR